MDSLASFSEDNNCGLLGPPLVEYSNVTLHRAFAVWKQLGQMSVRFKDVCNYFHYKETLDLNLQSRRQELIAMIDDFENKDCSSCKQLKCRCSKIKPIAQSCIEGISQASISSHSKQPLNTSKEAPSAQVLPKPQSVELKEKDPVSSTPKKSEKNAWVRILTTTAVPNTSECNSARIYDLGESSSNWPELKPGWDKRTSMKRQQNINQEKTSVCSFKNPSRPHSSAETNVSFVSNKLAAAYISTPKKSNDYTYF